MTELEEDERERERADRMVRQYRCENLFWRLWGIPMDMATAIADAVWEVDGTSVSERNKSRPCRIVFLDSSMSVVIPLDAEFSIRSFDLKQPVHSYWSITEREH